MKWNKTKDLLPEEGLFMDKLPYLCVEKEECFLGFINNNGEWIEYKSNKVVKSPVYWAKIDR